VPIFHSVKKVEGEILRREKTKEYLPIEGSPEFVEHVGELVFGRAWWNREKSRVFGAQAPGGTGALRVGGEFFRKEIGRTIAIPSPTWPNHRGVFERSGLTVRDYDYYDVQRHQIRFPEIERKLKRLPSGTAVLFHACCHNPSGADFSLDEWTALAKLCRTRKLFPFFDFAYQGFGSGVEADRRPILLFLKEGLELFVAVSQSKNFGLYAERVGALFIVTSSSDERSRVGSNVQMVVRRLYSTPPKHGAEIVIDILSSPTRKRQWRQELDGIREELGETRRKLADLWTKMGLEMDFLHHRNGFFFLTGLTPKQIDFLRTEHAIYMPRDGRFNLAGLPRDRLHSVAEAVAQAFLHSP
jgi:aspartate/tyrosine/aromatic aminotransferase